MFGQQLQRWKMIALGLMSAMLLTVTAAAAPASAHAASHSALAVQSKSAVDALSGASASSTHNQQGACEQPPPQSVKDRATYTAAELERYGLPPRTAAEPFEKWARIVRAVKTRACDSFTTSTHRTQQIRSATWAGNYANQPAPGKFYTEADMDFYIPCITGNTGSDYDFSAWVGLGGAAIDGSKNVVDEPLIQTGIENVWTGTQWQYRAWYENTKGGSHQQITSMANLRCGDHMYAKAWKPNNMFILDINTGVSFQTPPGGYGDPSYTPHTAEFIVERKQDPNSTTRLLSLANFGSVTFYGVGITYGGQYLGMNQVPHDYSHMYHCGSVHDTICDDPKFNGPPYGSPEPQKLANTNPILSDPGNPPYDKYTVNWVAYS